MKVFFLSYLLLASCTVFSQKKESSFLLNFKNSSGAIFNFWGNTQNNLPEGKGIGVYNYGGKHAFYIGEYKKGLRSGKGIMHFSSGHHYEGNWLGDTAATGNALYYVNELGSYYEGELRSYQYEGEGKFYFSNGRVIVGSFKNNMQNGYCVFQQRNGAQYEGNFVDGKYEGEGRYTDSAGEVKEGIWKAGVLETPKKVSFSGKKTRYKVPGDPFLLDYKNELANIFSYRGAVKNGIPNGQGVGTYYYGKTGYGIYVGNYTMGMREGKGDFYYHTGAYFTGEWKKDSLLKGTFYYANGHRYNGSFVSNKKEGYGEFYFVDGRNYAGGFKADKYDGKGLYTSNQFTYEGEFKEDKYQGKGKHVEGAVIKDGNWEAGVFKGTVAYKLPKDIKPFAGVDNIAGDKTKKIINDLFKAYDESKFNAMRGSLVRTSEKGEKYYQPKIKLSGVDSLLVVNDTVAIYASSFGGFVNLTEANEAYAKMEGWLLSFLDKESAYVSYTSVLHNGASPFKTATFVNKSKNASLSLYLQFKNGVYQLQMALAKRFLTLGSSSYYNDYYDDEDDWYW